MGTRSSIAILHSSGQVTSIYCHWDGYPEYNGVILLENYSVREKTEELMTLGNLASLGKKIGSKHDFDHPPRHDCNSYLRDGGQDTQTANVWNSVEEWLAHDNQRYNYLQHPDGTWKVYSYEYEATDLIDVLLERAEDREEKLCTEED